MFRQVVSHTWKPETTDEEKQGFRDGLDLLRDIPEVVTLRYGDDHKRFEGNFDFILMMDFADFASARRYVDHPLHRRFVEEHATKLVADRVVVQHEWGEEEIVGLHHLKLPVTDVQRSRTWYAEVLGFESDLEFVEDGELRGVALRHRVADVRLALREDPARAKALAGFDAMCLALSTRSDLEAVVEAVKRTGASHGEIRTGAEGWSFDVTDPDGHVVRLYTHERFAD